MDRGSEGVNIIRPKMFPAVWQECCSCCLIINVIIPKASASEGCLHIVIMGAEGHRGNNYLVSE